MDGACQCDKVEEKQSTIFAVSRDNADFKFVCTTEFTDVSIQTDTSDADMSVEPDLLGNSTNQDGSLIN